MNRTTLLALSLLVLSLACRPSDEGAVEARLDRSRAALPKPPQTKIAAVTDVLHGERIVDPYRWLERDSPAAARWIAAQNRHTRSVLDRISGRAELQRRLERLLRVEKIGCPRVRVDHAGRLLLFHSRRAPDQNQPLLYLRRGLSGSDRALVDPNRLARDGTVALDWWYPSPRGRYVAYGLSSSGDEMSELRVYDVEAAADLPDRIPRTPHTSLAWLPDGSGFYYVRLPVKGSVPAGQEHYHRHVYYHALGSDPWHDPHVFGRGRDMREMPSVRLSPRGRYLVISANLGWGRSELYLKDRTRPGAPFVAMVKGRPHRYVPKVLDDQIYVMTDEGAPRMQVFSVDPRRPARASWKRVIGQSSHTLRAVDVVGGRLLAVYMERAISRLRLFTRRGKQLGEIPLPGIGAVRAVGGKHDAPHLFLSFISYMAAPRILHGSIAHIERALAGSNSSRRSPWPAERRRPPPGDRLRRGGLSVWARVRSSIDPSTVELRQETYRSRDGTPVTLFIMHKKGLRRDGNNPALLYGYGGFNVPIVPRYRPQFYELIRRGAVYAEANLRGGGEYGKAWHRAGTLGRKQNVFDDYIAASEHLMKRGYTRRGRLALIGGSNGGLLTGAIAVQRPGLVKAIVCAVPLLDMLRYHRFLIAKLWVPEYGSADDPRQFRWLRAYSPYHNVTKGTAYPAILFTSGVSDSRVHPFHARKMAARLQAETGGAAPILLRTETKAGHGAGKPVNKRIAEMTDMLSFIMWQLGMLDRR